MQSLQPEQQVELVLESILLLSSNEVLRRDATNHLIDRFARVYATDDAADALLLVLGGDVRLTRLLVDSRDSNQYLVKTAQKVGIQAYVLVPSGLSTQQRRDIISRSSPTAPFMTYYPENRCVLPGVSIIFSYPSLPERITHVD